VNWLLGLKIDLAKSFIIGDRFIYQVDCGCDAGCKTFLLMGISTSIETATGIRAGKSLGGRETNPNSIS
jgi:hypothetical protein